jgi:hypothetical protein
MFTDKQEYHDFDNNDFDNNDNVSIISNKSNVDCDVFEKINKFDYYFINIFYTNFFLVLILSCGMIIFFI